MDIPEYYLNELQKLMDDAKKKEWRDSVQMTHSEKIDDEKIKPGGVPGLIMVNQTKC